MHAHHIHPKWAGGEDKLTNLVTLCPPCHKFAPEAGEKAEANERINAYLSTSVRPEIDLFTFGMEFAIQNGHDSVDEAPAAARNAAQAVIEFSRDDEDAHEPVSNGEHWWMLYNASGHS